VVPSSGPKEFSLSLNATQPTEEYYQIAKTAKLDPKGLTSPPNQGGRESSKQFKTMLMPSDGSRKTYQD
jgi:hypothetical protein